MNGISVQIGPRSVGRRCAAWGRVVARNRFIAGLVLIAVAFETILAVTMIVLGHTGVPPAHVPLYFCPAGQHMTGTASGWPVCVPDH